MLIARSNFASLTTISEEIQRHKSGLVFALNEDSVLQQVSYYGRGYTLTIDFLKEQHEIWTIMQSGEIETYLVWCGFPYQKQYASIKNQIWGDEQSRLRFNMQRILSAIRQTETSIA